MRHVPIPIPRAESMTAGETASSPATVLLTTEQPVEEERDDRRPQADSQNAAA